MARICPQCGAKAIDDQSAFCNKCGTPFPADQPRKVLVRTAPRLADTVPAPPPQQPAAEPVVRPDFDSISPPPPPARSSAEPARVRVPSPKPARKPAPGPQPFRRLIARDSLKTMYWLGVIAILLVVLSGILADTVKEPGTTLDEAADASKESPLDLLSAIPLFWIGIFILANLSWRVMCETSAVLLSRSDPPDTPAITEDPAPDSLFDDATPAADPGASVECPRCGRVVSPADLKTCESCGVQGCSSCIRLMGLLKKKWTCRDCYERK